MYDDTKTQEPVLAQGAVTSHAEKLPRLKMLIRNPVIAWDASSVAASAAIHTLSSAFLGELEQNRNLLQEEIPLEGQTLSSGSFRELKHETALVRREMLDGGLGFVILRGLESATFSQLEMENLFWRICNELGTPLVQKAETVRFGRVENLGMAAGTRPRYHETGSGGSVHTDSPIMKRVTDYVGLLCVRTAIEGGHSKFVSIARVHNLLLEHAPELLGQLYQPFFFDRRVPKEQVSARNPAYLRAPIFSYDPAKGDRGLSLRWQPEYVWEAQRLNGVPTLSDRRERALRILEEMLEDRAGNLTVVVSMRPGDIQLLNNHAVAHGRTSFADHYSSHNPPVPDPDRRRLLRRVWLEAHV